MDASDMETVSKETQLDNHNVETQAVISLLLSKDDCSSPVQVDFPIKSVSTVPMSSPNSTTISVTTVSSPLNISQVEFTDSGILLQSDDAMQHGLDSDESSVHLENASFHQTLSITDESDSCDGTTKFIDGQAVRLEDGTTAFIHTAPREGLQPVQLEDGTMAYLSQTNELFNGEASGLDLEQLSSPQVPSDNLEEDKEAVIKMTSAEMPQIQAVPKQRSANEKSFQCLYEGCNRVYTTPHHLKVHERSHTGDRPFKCEALNCRKAFATGYGLKSHTRVHTGETPYLCTEESCKKGFKTSGDLQKHLRTHTGERPFKCPFDGCDRAFTTSNIRKVHIRTHTGERPYVCDNCGRAFASATNFKNHIRIHTGEKPYVCSFQGCNKKFTEYSSLYKHHVVHTRDKPYMCTMCGKHYRQTSTLAMHRRTSHGLLELNDDGSVTNTAISQDETKEKGLEDKKPCFEFEFDGTLADDSGNFVITSASNASGLSGATSTNKKTPTIIALQRSTNSNSQMSQHAPVYALHLQDGTVSSTQQFLLVTDPEQVAAIQRLAQQVQIPNLLTTHDLKTE